MNTKKKFDVELYKEVRQLKTWGSYGKRGDQPLVRKPVALLSTPHIMAIRLTQHQISNNMKKILADEIHYRELFPEEDIKEDD